MAQLSLAEHHPRRRSDALPPAAQFRKIYFFSENLLTIAYIIMYNTIAYAHDRAQSPKNIIKFNKEVQYAPYISAEKASSLQGPRFPQENGYRRRQKGPQEKTSEGQSPSNSLNTRPPTMHTTVCVSEVFA